VRAWLRIGLAPSESDRLTRSWADFAKLVELFDRHSVSFVAVTQQFNTTTSMGRNQQWEESAVMLKIE
jgi:DNA invertase Pin-like site-specific DNA recombinase